MKVKFTKISKFNFLIITTLLLPLVVNAQNFTEDKTNDETSLSSENINPQFPYFNFRIDGALMYHYLKDFKSNKARELFKDVKTNSFHADSLDKSIQQMRLKAKRTNNEKKKDSLTKEIKESEQKFREISELTDVKTDSVLYEELKHVNPNAISERNRLITNTDILPAKGNSTTIETSIKEPALHREDNVEFRVQIGAFSKMPTDIQEKLRGFENHKVFFVRNANGQTICTAGSFKLYKPATELKIKLIEAGLSDAFLVAYKGTKQISVKSAFELKRKQKK